MPERKELTAADVMSIPVLCVPPTAAVEGVVRIMRNHGIGALPVTDESGWPLGIVSLAELLAEGPGVDEQSAATLMNSPPQAVQTDTPASVIAELFTTQQTDHALVLSRGRLVGMVSATDLADRARALTRGEKEVESDERLKRRIIASLRAAEPSLAKLPDFSISEGIVHFWRDPPTAEELEAIVRAINDSQA